MTFGYVHGSHVVAVHAKTTMEDHNLRTAEGQQTYHAIRIRLYRKTEN